MPSPSIDSASVTVTSRLADQMFRYLDSVVLGQRHAVEACLVACMARGHLLLEGPPGVGKTSLAKAFADGFEARFQRIQMTSDLLPTDILGSLRQNALTKELDFKPGPIFCQVLLADELNRTSPKTQAALLEAMAEQKVTFDGKTYDLPNPFFVIATQNPQEFQGTYLLSESQLDRFILRIAMPLPSLADEKRLMQNYSIGEASSVPTSSKFKVEDLLMLQAETKKVFIEESLLDFAQQLALSIRSIPDVTHGVSIRAMLQWLDTARASALLAGRSFVVPGDLLKFASEVLAHRLCFRGISPSFEDRCDRVKDAVAKITPPN